MPGPVFDKEGIMRWHRTLDQLRRYLIESGALPADVFAAYDKLGVRPGHIHRDAHTHLLACEVLQECIRLHLADKRGAP